MHLKSWYYDPFPFHFTADAYINTTAGKPASVFAPVFDVTLGSGQVSLRGATLTVW